MDRVEGGPTWLAREHADSDAVFSPDGRFVAYVSWQTERPEVYIRLYPGPGGQTPVSVGGGTEPLWAPTGELFYRRTADYMMIGGQVSTDPVLTVGPPLELFEGGRATGPSLKRRYDVTADGQRFLMSTSVLGAGEMGAVADRAPKVVVVQDWVEELRQRVPVE